MSHHDPVVDVVVISRNEKGRPVVVEHRCRECGRLVSGGKHTGP